MRPPARTAHAHVVGQGRDVTVAIYAARRAQSVVDEMEKAVVLATKKVLGGCGVADVTVRWVEYGEDEK